MTDENKAAIAAFEADKHRMDKYSRQVGEYGVAAMAKLVQMKVLVIGLKGVGIEAAKNLVLAGVGTVTLYDDETVTMNDLGTNFYLSESDVNKTTCARASLPQLKALNPLVNVTSIEGDLTNKHIKTFTMILDCGFTLKEAIECNKQCRKYGVKFVKSRVHGLVGYMFSDFGKEFAVLDKTGEPTVTRIIDTIITDPNTPGEIIVRVIPSQVHNIQFDDHIGYIRFEEVEGKLGKVLNSSPKPFKVKMNMRETSEGQEIEDNYSLRVELGAINVGDLKYEGGGQIIQTKVPVVLKFNPLEQNLLNPIHPDRDEQSQIMDFTKFGRDFQLHLGLVGLWKYEEAHKGLPPANNSDAINAIVDLAKQYNEEMKEDKANLSVDELDEEVISNLARFAECNFQPLCCFFGGVVAQEVVKYTGKYTPAQQWLHMDAFEVLPDQQIEKKVDGEPLRERQKKAVLPEEDVFVVTDADRQPIGSRYDDLIKIIGLPLHKKLMASSTFMVGCGALGCELLKNFALLGLSCDQSGKGCITVTDNDTIEVSNLSRQFLFREENIDQPKSVAANDSVRKMNPDINVKSLQLLANQASEGKFNADFWEGIDFVTNALDNIKARTYVDGQCVFYSKPLLESGTLGVKCNTQVVLPYMTQSYSDGPVDDGGDAIPMCTLRNFPSLIEHCIEWARAGFTDLLETESTKASNYLKNPTEYVKDLRAKTLDLASSGEVLSAVAREIESLEKVYDILMKAKSPETTFETCVREAYEVFHRLFRDKIVSLIKAHPEDDMDEEGNKFWNKKKRFPQVALFGVEDPLHLNFVLAMANILSLSYGVVSGEDKFVTDVAVVKDIVRTLTPPQTKLEKVDTSEDDSGEQKKEEAVVAEETTDDSVDKFEKLLKDLEELATSSEIENIKVEAISFEKDDDANFHIDFITATSNLRAWNYKLKSVTRHKCKMIAGKIIPALATTTAAVTGLVAIDLLKLLQPGKKIEAFKESSNNLGINNYFIMPPTEPSKAKDEEDVMTLSEVVCLPSAFTKWDRMILGDGETNLTLIQFIRAFNSYCKDKFEIDAKISVLFHNNANYEGLKGFSTFLYNEDKDGAVEYGTDEPSSNEKLNKPLKDFVVETYGEQVLGKTTVKVDCACAGLVDGEEQDYKVPDLYYRFAK